MYTSHGSQNQTIDHTMRPPVASSSRILPLPPFPPRASRFITFLPRFSSPPPRDHRKRPASTASAETDWLAWLRKASLLRLGNGSDAGRGRTALLFAGLVRASSVPSVAAHVELGFLSTHTAFPYPIVDPGMGTGERGNHQPRRDDRVWAEGDGRVRGGYKRWARGQGMDEGLGRGTEFGEPATAWPCN